VQKDSGLYPLDLYGFADALPDAEAETLRRLRTLLERELFPVLAENWERGEFPDEIIAPIIALDLMDPNRDDGRTSALYSGFRTFELARADASLATFHNAHAGLFRTAVEIGGSPQQVEEWDPLIRDWKMTGTFALTEPDHGSDIARGLATSCRRDGDTWSITGRKRWIGGAAAMQKIVVFARDVADGEVKAFVIPSDADGMRLTKITGKVSLRIMQNFDIDMDGVQVEDEWRLGGIASFRDVAACLRRMRSDVAWLATGTVYGALEAARRYVSVREQFGAPIGSYQLVQEKLASMTAEVTACLGLVVGLTRRQAQGIYRDEDSALAKLFTARAVRSVTAQARDLCGGNGITLDSDVARFHADAEAIYSFEGTDTINALVLGRALTGRSAFTRTKGKTGMTAIDKRQ
jgi:glutaryl-CoA dehydrogenase